MSNLHRGNQQPEISREEHARIGNTDGKKVFVIDNNDNQIIDFVNPTSNVTVEQGTTPWNSLGTTTIANSLVTVTLGTQLDPTNDNVGIYGSATIIQQDDATNAILTVDYSHHEVHEGSHYFVQGWVDLAASTALDFLFVTPNTTKWAHAQWTVGTEAEGLLELYEGSTIAANGSAVTIYNNDRNSGNTAGVTAFSTPSVTATGGLIYAAKLGSGRNAGGDAGRDHEIIAKQNTNYLFRITNNDGSATRYATYDFSWYEHTSIA